MCLAGYWCLRKIGQCVTPHVRVLSVINIYCEFKMRFLYNPIIISAQKMDEMSIDYKIIRSMVWSKFVDTWSSHLYVVLSQIVATKMEAYNCTGYFGWWSSTLKWSKPVPAWQCICALWRHGWPSLYWKNLNALHKNTDHSTRHLWVELEYWPNVVPGLITENLNLTSLMLVWLSWANPTSHIANLL